MRSVFRLALLAIWMAQPTFAGGGDTFQRTWKPDYPQEQVVIVAEPDDDSTTAEEITAWAVLLGALTGFVGLFVQRRRADR